MKFLTKTIENGSPTFILGDGQRVVLDPTRCTETIRLHAQDHGFLQKVGDGASGFAKSRNFEGAKAAMQAIVDTLYDGGWNRKGAGTGLTDLVTALMNLTGKPLEKIQAAVDRFDNEGLKKVVRRKDVKAELARIRYERAKAGISDTDPDIEDLI